MQEAGVRTVLIPLCRVQKETLVDVLTENLEATQFLLNSEEGASEAPDEGPATTDSIGRLCSRLRLVTSHPGLLLRKGLTFDESLRIDQSGKFVALARYLSFMKANHDSEPLTIGIVASSRETLNLIHDLFLREAVFEECFRKQSHPKWCRQCRNLVENNYGDLEIVLIETSTLGVLHCAKCSRGACNAFVIFESAFTSAESNLLSCAASKIPSSLPPVVRFVAENCVDEGLHRATKLGSTLEESTANYIDSKRFRHAVTFGLNSILEEVESVFDKDNHIDPALKMLSLWNVGATLTLLRTLHEVRIISLAVPGISSNTVSELRWGPSVESTGTNRSSTSETVYSASEGVKLPHSWPEDRLSNGAAVFQHVTGDAAVPRAMQSKPFVILHTINASATWPSGGFFGALKRAWPGIDGKHSLLASNLDMGQVHFIRVQVSPVPGAVALLVAHLQHQRNAVDWTFFRQALRKLSFALHRGVPEHGVCCGAGVHAPRIGEHLAPDTWGMAERLLREYLVNKGINVTVYRFSRRFARCPLATAVERESNGPSAPLQEARRRSRSPESDSARITETQPSILSLDASGSSTNFCWNTLLRDNESQ